MTRALLLFVLACYTSDFSKESQDTYRKHLELCYEQGKALDPEARDEAFNRCLHGHAMLADGGQD